MLVLKAQLTIAPQHKRDFMRHMQTLVQTSLTEDGCISFGCYEDTAAPNSFIVLQEWENQTVLDHHEYSEHVAAFKAAVGRMIVSREPTCVYTVSYVGDLDS